MIYKANTYIMIIDIYYIKEFALLARQGELTHSISLKIPIKQITLKDKEKTVEGKRGESSSG